MTGRAIVWIKRSQGRTHFLIPSSSRPTQSHVGVDPPLFQSTQICETTQKPPSALFSCHSKISRHTSWDPRFFFSVPPHQAAARVHALPEIATCDQSFCSVSTYTQCPLPLSSQYLCLGLAGGGEPLLLLLLLLQRRHSKQPKPWSRQTSEPRRRTLGGLRRRRGHFTGRVPP